MTKTILLFLIVSTCLCGQVFAWDIHITAVTGGVYVGRQETQVLSMPILDANNELDPEQILLKKDKSMS